MTQPAERPRISPWYFWIASAVTTMFVPSEVRDIYDSISSQRVIAEHGRLTTGRVVQHEQRQGAGSPGCRSRVTVAYEVAGTAYRMTAIVCNSSPDRLPVGRPLEVRYQPNHPEIAILAQPSISERRPDWSSLLITLAIPVSLAWLGWLAHKHGRAGGRA